MAVCATTLWRSLPALLFVLAGSSLVVVGWRSLAAERALAEGTCRRQLEAIVAEAAARLKTAAAEATGVAMGPAPHAVVAAGGRFLVPAEPRVRGRLELPSSAPARARLQIATAAQQEAQGDVDGARQIYLSLSQDGEEPACRSVALHRLSCLERRAGNIGAAGTLLQAFHDTLPAMSQDTWEALFARAARAHDDPLLRDDLLLALDTVDEPIAVALLRECGLADDQAVADRRAALERVQRIRPLLVEAAAQPRGARCVPPHVIAWWTDAEQSVRFAERDVPPLPSGVSLVDATQIPARDDLLVASAPLELGGTSALATQPMSEVDAMASRRRWQFATVFALLLVGGGASVAMMQRAVRREADAARVRSQFIARIGHDVRTPLTLIRMYAETLAAGKVNDGAQAREFAAIAAREAERLSKMVQKVLDFSRTVERAQPLPAHRIDLVALARDVIAAHRPVFEQAGLQLELQASGPPAVVVGDADALRGMLGNLLENGLHHAASGRAVDISVAAGDGSVTLAVQDRGPGLPRAVRDRLFERFVRGPDARHPGTGLGLALVREIAQAHGGTVAAAEREGGGATITVTLPRSTEASA